jgi:surface protein
MKNIKNWVLSPTAPTSTDVGWIKPENGEYRLYVRSGSKFVPLTSNSSERKNKYIKAFNPGDYDFTRSKTSFTCNGKEYPNGKMHTIYTDDDPSISDLCGTMEYHNISITDKTVWRNLGVENLILENVNYEKNIYIHNLFSFGSSRLIIKGTFTYKKGTDWRGAFENSSWEYIDLSSIDTSEISKMSNMFSFCRKLKSLDLSHFDTSNVTSMSNMFSYCTSLTSLDLFHFDTSKVIYMDGMFNYCTSLEYLNISSFNTENVKGIADIFKGCSAITTLIVGENFGKITYQNTIDFSPLTSWTNKVTTLKNLYNRKSNGLKDLTIRLSATTYDTLGTTNINTITNKGYIVTRVD